MTNLSFIFLGNLYFTEMTVADPTNPEIVCDSTVAGADLVSSTVSSHTCSVYSTLSADNGLVDSTLSAGTGSDMTSSQSAESHQSTENETVICDALTDSQDSINHAENSTSVSDNEVKTVQEYE